MRRPSTGTARDVETLSEFRLRSRTGYATGTMGANRTMMVALLDKVRGHVC